MSALPAVKVSHHTLPFGKHRLPVDTARVFWILPCYDKAYKLNRGRYDLTIRFDTFCEGKPAGWGYFSLSVDTLQKAQNLVQKLCECNVKWEMWFDQIKPSLKERTIDLHFKSMGMATQRVNWGELYLLFQGALGLISFEYKAQIQRTHGGGSVQFTFEVGPSLQTQMEKALNRLYDVSENEKIAHLLKSDLVFGFTDKKEIIREKSPYEDCLERSSQISSSGTGPVYLMNAACPLFKVTEESMELERSDSGDESLWQHWKEENLFDLISERAPSYKPVHNMLEY